jgi:hypothetical protein
MIKPNSCIYLVPLYPVFNEKEVRTFNSFSTQDSASLYSALYLNLKEITDNISPFVETIYCFDKIDKEYILPEFPASNSIFINLSDKSILFRTLSEKYFSLYSNNLIIFVNATSIYRNNIIKYLDLLNREDESLLIGKSNNGKVSYIGFNIYNNDLFFQIEATDLKFDNLLHLACRFDYFINVLTDSLFIENINDFKILYKELSKKESLNYCSQNIHEKFTHLFIEYKELLK